MLMPDRPQDIFAQRVQDMKTGLKVVGKAALQVMAAIAEVHERWENTPVPCERCAKMVLRREIRLAEYSIPSNLPKGFVKPYGWCPECIEIFKRQVQLQLVYEERNQALARENRRVWANLERARRKGLPATLTLEQWVYIGNQFGWKCAYCGEPFDVLEHYIPIDLGGGTTADNVFPACAACNAWKGARHPGTIKETVRSPDAVRRAAAKLTQLQLTMPGQVIQIPALQEVSQDEEVSPN